MGRREDFFCFKSKLWFAVWSITTVPFWLIKFHFRNTQKKWTLLVPVFVCYKARFHFTVSRNKRCRWQTMTQLRSGHSNTLVIVNSNKRMDKLVKRRAQHQKPDRPEITAFKESGKQRRARRSSYVRIKHLKYLQSLLIFHKFASGSEPRAFKLGLPHLFIRPQLSLRFFVTTVVGQAIKCRREKR